jgi:LL-diaminopimelate aminotransferase
VIQPAERLTHFAPHFFATQGARIAAMQAQGMDIIRLDEGAPDLPPAPPIIEALTRGAARPDTHSYQPHRGPQALREAWAEMYRRVHGVALDPQREIIPLQGSKEGIFHFTTAFVNPGDIVLIPDPGYITYTRSALFAGGTPHYLPMHAAQGWLPDLQAIPVEVLRRAKLLWLNYPNNPTGAVAPPAFLQAAVDFARHHNLLLCHDAAYTQVTFDGYHAPSIFEIADAKEIAVEFSSLSKSHNMAGWRVGALLGNAAALGAYFTLKTNADSSHFLPVLEAAAEAMRGDQAWLNERNEVYRQRRDSVIAALRALGLQAEPPRASLYVWSPVPAGQTSRAFVERALDEAHVSLTPGTLFGARGEGYVRLSLTVPAARLEEAMQRLGRWLEG